MAWIEERISGVAVVRGVGTGVGAIVGTGVGAIVGTGVSVDVAPGITVALDVGGVDETALCSVRVPQPPSSNAVRTSPLMRMRRVMTTIAEAGQSRTNRETTLQLPAGASPSQAPGSSWYV